MKKNRIALILCSAVVSVSAQAQEAAGIDLGGFQLIPTLNTTLKYDDNVTRSNNDAISSWVTLLTPELLLSNNFSGNELKFGYRMQRGDYFSSQQDDFTDNFLFSSLNYEFNSRNRFKANVDYEDGHDDRGTRYSSGAGATLNTPDKYKKTSAGAVYSYGASTAIAKIDLNLDYMKLNYDINTPAYLIRDRDTKGIGSTFYYTIAPATDLTLDLDYKKIDYDFTPTGGTVLDSKEKSVLLGAKWESTAATTGFAKVGLRKKDFDAASRSSFSGITWLAGVRWDPNDIDSIELTTNGGTRETTGEGNFIKSKDVSVKWSHDWLDRLSSNLSVGYGKDDYVSDSTDRSDNNTQYRVALNYDFSRWLTFDLGYTYDDRSSNRDTVEYNRNIYSLNAYFTL